MDSTTDRSDTLVHYHDILNTVLEPPSNTADLSSGDGSKIGGAGKAHLGYTAKEMGPASDESRSWIQ